MDSIISNRGTLSNSINYSLMEQSTDKKWIDGKDIYQRTIQYQITTSGSDIVIENLSTYNIDQIISCDGFFGQAGNHEAFVGFRYDSNAYFFIPYYNYNTKSLVARIYSGYVGFTAYITIQYTKNI